VTFFINILKCTSNNLTTPMLSIKIFSEQSYPYTLFYAWIAFNAKKTDVKMYIAFNSGNYFFLSINSKRSLPKISIKYLTKIQRNKIDCFNHEKCILKVKF